MKYQVGQFILNLNAFGYNINDKCFNRPVIMQIVEVLRYKIVAVHCNNKEDMVTISKAGLKDNYKLLSPVEVALYE